MVIYFVILLILGLSNYYFRYTNFKSKYTKGKFLYKGEVINLLNEGEYYNKYLFRLSNNDKMYLYVFKEIPLNINDEIEFEGDFEPPNVSMNKGAFNEAFYLYSEKIYGSIYIKSENKMQVVSNKFSLVNTIRSSIFNVLGKILPKNHFGIVLGMIIGDT